MLKAKLVRWIRLFPPVLLGAIFPLTGANAQSVGDGVCTVSILNQTAFVQPDGSWVLPNVPSNMGPVRARVTCIANGQTIGGSSSFFTIATNGVSGVPKVVLGAPAPIPIKISVSAPSPHLTATGQTVQLSVAATFADASTQNFSAGTTGTIYQTTNSKVATVSADGLVTAVSSGRALVTALNEAILGAVLIDVSMGGDSDGDGIPDDIELANGLDPNNPADALADFDGDGLTNFQELMVYGTDIRKADTDGDGLTDGDEVNLYHTNPLLADTDGDGLRDGLEIQTGSDPNDPNSYNLAAALRLIEITPANFVLTVNTIAGEVSQQLRVVGQLIDGFFIDLTAASRRTSYSSSDLAICNFGAESGQIFAGANGTCIITASNNRFSAQANGTVTTFSPTALSFITIPGFAHNVDINGNYAYVAAGSAGLVVVDVSNRTAPQIVAILDTPGKADNVKVVGNLVYLADGPSGLEIVDVADPAAPVLLGSVDTPGDALDVVVTGNRALVADGPGGIQLIDVSAPAHPVLLRTVPLPAGVTSVFIRGVDRKGSRAVFAGDVEGSAPFNGIGVIDLTDEVNPVIVGGVATGDARNVVLRDRYAFVADLSSSLTTVDLLDPAHPQVLASTPLETGGRLLDVALAGSFAFGADIFFVNGVPIVNIENPANPLPRAILDFQRFRDDNGTGIAVDARYVYLTASASLDENAFGDSRLYIGQYIGTVDTAGIPPVVAITSPASGFSVIEGSTLPVTVQASDDLGVAAVDLLVNGQVVATDTAAPYEFNVSIPVGAVSMTLGARAADFGDNATLAQEIQVKVTPDQPPVVAITSPAPGSSAVEGANLHVAVLASDDVKVASVDLLVNGQVVATVTVAHLELTVAVPVGATSMTLGARATDFSGHTTLAQEVQVTVTPNQPPTVSITSPVAGATVIERSPILVAARATDDLDSIASVAFFANGVPVGIAGALPYETIVTVPVGGTDLALGAVATDNLGHQAAAMEVHLNVIPDPGTTAVGRTIDADGHPVAGADVLCAGVKGLSAADGSFSIGGVPAFQSFLKCVVLRVDNLSGKSAPVPPVPGGMTVMGDVILGRHPLFPGPKSAVGDQTIAIVTGDFDGDGVPDLATANATSADLSVLIGKGNGTFQPERRQDLGGGSPAALVTADFNGDGKLDLASTTGTGDTSSVEVLLGNGDGSFQAGVRYPTEQNPTSLVTADFNGDGMPDLAAADAGDDDGGFAGVSILLGKGDGTFAARHGLAVGAQPADVVVGDFNGDGFADLVVANRGSGDLSLLLGNGDGTFQPEVRFGRGLGRILPSMGPPIAVGDFNGDGKSDLAAVDILTSQLIIFLGNAAGTPQEVDAAAAGPDPNGVWVVDLDGDGQLDLVTWSVNHHELCLSKGTGTTSFLPARCFDPGSGFSAVAVTDLNRDRIADLVIALPRLSIFPSLSGIASDLVVFLGDRDGLPESFRTVPLDKHPRAVAVGDLNHDGFQDVVTTNDRLSGDKKALSVLLGHADGTFQNVTSVTSVTEDPLNPGPLTLADFNHDGNLDLATANVPCCGVVSLQDIPILLGNGDGTFQEKRSGSATSGAVPVQVRTADVNRDGTIDLIVPERGAASVLVFLGKGDGTFLRQPEVFVGGNPQAVTVADFNRDGALDLVAAKLLNQDIAVVLGNGDGTFRDANRIRLGFELSAITSADLNADGLTDLVVAAFDANGGLLVLLGNGDGTFQAPVYYDSGSPGSSGTVDFSGSSPIDVQVTDIDRDGRPDLIALNGGSEDVAVLLGNGDGTFQKPQRFATLAGPVALAIEDMDQDSLPDLVVANHTLQALTILTRTVAWSAVQPSPPLAAKSLPVSRLASLSGPVCRQQEPQSDSPMSLPSKWSISLLPGLQQWTPAPQHPFPR